MWIWWAVAASFILFEGIFYLYNRKPDYKQLVMNAALSDFPQIRGAEDNLDSLFSAGAYQLFINKATPYLKDSLDLEKKTQLTVNIVRCYILLSKPDEAINFLANTPAEIKTDCSMRYVEALVLIELKENKKVIDRLDSIVSDKCYPLDAKAKDLKKQLE